MPDGAGGAQERLVNCIVGTDGPAGPSSLQLAGARSARSRATRATVSRSARTGGDQGPSSAGVLLVPRPAQLATPGCGSPLSHQRLAGRAPPGDDSRQPGQLQVIDVECWKRVIRELRSSSISSCPTSGGTSTTSTIPGHQGRDSFTITREGSAGTRKTTMQIVPQQEAWGTQGTS